MARASLDRCWYAVATSDGVALAPVAVEVLDRTYVLWRGADTRLIAAPDRCTHREARLSLGSVEDGCLRCPYHGWGFGPEGRCVDVPSSGEGATIPPSSHLDTVRVAERYGLVWLCPSEPTHPIPHLAVDDDSTFTRLNTGMQVWSAT